MQDAARTPRLAVAAGGSGGSGGSGGGSDGRGRPVGTRALLEAIRLLQLSRLELIAEIAREVEANPVSTPAARGSARARR